MKNKYKTMIYPFDIESTPLLRHSNFIDNFNFTHVVSPNGWGLSGKDAGYADDGQSIGMIVDSDFDKALENCDTVFFNESNVKLDLDKFIYPKIIKAAENSKNIICTIQLKSEIFNKISDICIKNNKLFKYFTKTWDSVTHPKYENIYNINTPVIFVVGTCERTHKFEIQLNLRENLEKMGYKVSQIGSRHYCELMGFHSFPKLMYSKDITEWEKVILFNYFIKDIERREKPDVIIIGIPGGIMPITNEITNKFGILAYEISNAVKPDAVILSTLYKNYKSDFVQVMSKSFEYKFGYSIDCCNITNASLNITSGEDERSLQFLTMNYKFINEQKKLYNAIDIPVYNILDIDDSQNMTNFLVNKLAKYSEVTNI